MKFLSQLPWNVTALLETTNIVYNVIAFIVSINEKMRESRLFQFTISEHHFCNISSTKLLKCQFNMEKKLWDQLLVFSWYQKCGSGTNFLMNLMVFAKKTAY
jgi:hypothetical protein